MKQSLFTILSFFFIVINVFAQQPAPAPAIQWQNAIGGKYAGYVNQMIPTKDGGYIAVGSIDSSNGINIANYHGYNDAWVSKLDAHCNIIWQKCYGSSGNDWGNIIQQTNDGGYIIGGTPGSNDGDVSLKHGLVGIWIFKIDSTGNLQWEKTMGGSGSDIINNIKQTKDGGYIIAASTSSRNGDVTGHHNFGGLYLDDDGWIVKTDSVGNIEWENCFGGSNDDGLVDILQITDGSYIVSGFTASDDGDVSGNHGGQDAWVVKLNNKGIIQWQKCYGGSDREFIMTILKTSNGGFILGGGTYSNDGDVSGNHGGGDMWLLRIDSIGTILWQRCFGGSNMENFWDLQSTKDNGFIFCGTTQSNDGDVSGYHGSSDYWVVKTDSVSNIQWQRCLGGSGGEDCFNVYQTSDDGYILGGISDTDPCNGDVSIYYGINSLGIIDDWWVVKLAPEPKAINIIYNNNQLQIIPNPAHNKIGIEIAGIKEIRIMDIIGRQYIHQQIIDTIATYTYLNIQYLAKGMYIVQAVGNDGSIKVGRLLVE